MVLRAFAELRHLPDVTLHPGVERTDIDSLSGDTGIALPSEHAAVLRESNGIEAYAGFVRLFGVRTMQSRDSIVWNRVDHWKFAWGDRCSGYWCFGETAWGDQYAYALQDLRAGGNAPVYWLDALSMTPEVLASCFDEFFEKEFLRSAREPYDAMTRRARAKFGAIESNTHLAYVPSLLLGGIEDINHVEAMNARAAMICNGDIATQRDAGAPDGIVKTVEAYEDELHRMRLRLVWD